MKTYTEKSNAARAAKKANNGTLDGLTLMGSEGAWYYAKLSDVGDNHTAEPTVATVAQPAAPALPPPSMGDVMQVLGLKSKTPAAKKVSQPTRPLDVGAKAAEKSAPAVKAAPSSGARSTSSTTAKPSKKVPAKKAATKKAAPPAKKAPVKKAAAKKATKTVEVYDVKNGPTHGRIRGYKIDADREVKHGIARRSAGTIAGRLWVIFDRLAKAAGGPAKLEIATVRADKEIVGKTPDKAFNKNKVMIEFYIWRRFHGVRGQGKKQKVDK